MKKTVVFLLVALFLFAFVGCAPVEASAYAQYITASEKLAEVDSFAADLQIVMLAGLGGETQEINMSGSMKSVALGEADVEMEMDLSMGLLGTQMEMKMFYSGGWAYIEMMGQKVKQEMGVEEFQQQGAYNVQFDEAAVKDTVVEKVDDGTQITFTLDGAAMREVMESQLDSLAGGAGGLAGADMDFKDVDMLVLLDKDGNLKSIEMDFGMNMQQDGETGEINMEMTVDYTQIGGVTIEMPSDLDSYMEIPA